MINLLPPAKKQQIHAAQANVLLLRYCLASLVLAVLLATIVGITYLTLSNSKAAAASAMQEAEAKSTQYADTQAKAAEFTSNLAVAKTILDKEVRYTTAAINIAQTIPSGIILNSLQLNAQSFGTPMVLDAQGKTYDDAIRLKTAFEESPYFDEAHLLSVGESDDEAYPVSIQISVIIKQEIIKS